MSNYETRRQEGTDPIDRLEFDATTGKRAVYENLEYTPREGYVEVTNTSHGADECDAHTYRVDIADGVPTRCECPADQYHDGACKHRVGVALAEAVLEAAETNPDTPPVATDGGELELEEDEDEDEAPGYTYHREPSSQGGARYARCEGCGREVVPADPDRLLHAEGCPNAQEDRR